MNMRKREDEEGDTKVKSISAKKRRITLGDNKNIQQHSTRNQEGSSEDPIDMLEPESVEDEVTDQYKTNRGLMNLLTLTNKDQMTIEGRVNDACINAMSDALHKQVKKEEVSISHTQFFIDLIDRG